MADPDTSETPPEGFARAQTASERLEEVSFPLAARGYDRHAVDQFVDEVRDIVARLEARQTREGVVQQALDELGEETAGILQRAHQTADEITARSRAQADGRLQRAEREAEIVRSDADEYSQRVVVDTQLLWEERQRLIDDIRQLADEVLATADDAAERVTLPDGLTEPEEPGGSPGRGGFASGPAALSDDPETALDPTETAPTEPTTIAPAEPGPLPPADPATADPAPTEPYDMDREKPARIGPVDEPPPADDPHGGHTVELEALPGGGEQPPDADGERD